MRDSTSQLSELAGAEIDALRADGIEPTASEIVQLNALAWRVETPEARRYLSRGVPVEVCPGVNLWTLSIQAAEWYGRVSVDLPSDRMRTLALAYAMAHCYAPGDHYETDAESAPRMLERWRKSLRCTWEALLLAVDSVLDQDGEYEQPPDPADDGGESPRITYGGLSAFLAAATNESVEFWERRCAATYAYAVISAINRQNAERGQSVPGDPRIMAERALGWAASKIRKRAATAAGSVSDVE